MGMYGNGMLPERRRRPFHCQRSEKGAKVTANKRDGGRGGGYSPEGTQAIKKNNKTHFICHK